jgi:uncharacterized protein YcbX
MVIDKDNRFITQRKFSKMCLIRTELLDGALSISAEGSGDCPLPAGGHALKGSSVWGTNVQGEDCGNEAARWISDFIGKSCRIIYMPEDYARLVDTRFATQQQRVGFADGFPLLIATQASLDDFNQKISSVNSDLKIGMNRFRPNIVIAGSVAWAEDQWQRIAIGNIELSLVKPCSRCIMPSINPETAEKEMAVNQVLLKYRRRDKQTYFGQNAVYNSTGAITIGDEVVVLD